MKDTIIIITVMLLALMAFLFGLIYFPVISGIIVVLANLGLVIYVIGNKGEDYE